MVPNVPPWDDDSLDDDSLDSLAAATEPVLDALQLESRKLVGGPHLGILTFLAPEYYVPGNLRPKVIKSKSNVLCLDCTTLR